RRLARPRRAHHRDVVAAFDDEVDPVHGAHHRVAAAVGLRDAAQLDDRAHQRPPVRGKPEPPVAAAGVGSTSTSPSETPLMISVSAGPETPIRTGTTASTPSRRTVTVLRSPVVVIACVGAFSTPVAVPVVMDTFAVAPTPTPGGAVSNEIVTG